jgi:hypothetical protein
MNLEVNMRRWHPVRSCGISSRLHHLEAVGAVIIGEDFGQTVEVRVHRKAAIVRMRVATETVGLPDDQSGATNGIGGAIEDVTS